MREQLRLHRHVRRGGRTRAGGRVPPGAPPAHVAALNRENAARRSKGGRCGDVVIDVGDDDVYVRVELPMYFSSRAGENNTC